MPIYDLTYRHWAGDWTSHPYRWWVITRQGISQLARRKGFLILLFLSLIPFLVRCVMLYFAVVMGRITMFKVDARFFEAFLSQQQFATFIISIFAGAGLIANDLKANALQIYFSKAITRRDYLIGKLGVVVFFVSLTTLIPGILLVLIAAAFHSNFEFLQQSGWLVLPILGYSLIMIFTNSLVVLAMSALNRSARFAGIFFAAFAFFSQILYGVLSALLRTNSVSWISISHSMTQMGDVLFGSPLSYQTSPWISAFVLLVLIAGSVWIVHTRVRAVEVVK